MGNCKYVARIRRYIKDVLFCQTPKDNMQILASSAFFLQIDVHLRSRGNNMCNAPDVIRICLIVPVYVMEVCRGNIYEGRTESHEQLFFACELGRADEGECGGR